MTTPQVPNSAWLGGVAAVSDSDVWAVGGYRNWTTQSTLFEHWDGMGWTVLLGPSTQADVDLRGVDAASATDIWAVGLSSASPGYPAIVHWDGTAWSLVPSPQIAGGSLQDVAALSSTDAWAVGYTGSLEALIEHWDGRAWSRVPISIAGPLYGIDAVGPNDVWAVGRRISDTTTAQPRGALVEHWDGSAWSVVPTTGGNDYSSLEDVAAVSATVVRSVGMGSDGVDGPYGTGGDSGIFGRWDGSSFALTPVSRWSRVVGASGAGDVWARGPTLPGHWDGTTWSEVPLTYGPVGDFYGLDVTPSGNFWAVGANGGNRGVVTRLCPVRASDAGFSPTSASVAFQGSNVAWSFPKTNTQPHSVTDASALGLFDSGLRPPGSSFTTTLIAAGNYAVRDTATGNTSTIKIPLKVKPTCPCSSPTPTSDPIPSSYALTWASETPPPGYAIDVQIKRPGTSTYVYWQKRTRQADGAFVPDAGPGTYSFRARYRNLSNWSASGWSSAVTITVS